MNAHSDPRGWPARAATVLDRAESFYLRVLRALILVIATVLLAYAAWLAASSLYKISRSPDSVVEVAASVSPDELIDAQMPAAKTPTEQADGPRTNPAHSAFYASFVDRYYSLYRSKFEPYRKQEDKQLSKAEFDGAFLSTAARLPAIRQGELDFASDRADLESLLTAMQGATNLPATINRLNRYKRATKVAVREQVQRTRRTQVRGWDRYSSACSDWYESPVGCSVIRTVETPYTETITRMKYPAGTQSHTDIFRAFQDRFFQLLQERREANAIKAQQQREGILEGIGQGQLSLVTALQIVAGFLVLMFFFLLIAIERHQRKLAGSDPAVERELVHE